MAKTKSAGSTSLGRDSRPKYFGVKLFDGQPAQPGSVIIRQRGSKFVAGKNVRQGKDYTLYSVAKGVVKFATKKIKHFDGSRRISQEGNVVLGAAAREVP